MLNHESPPSNGLLPLEDVERTLFESIVPPDHFLRRLLQAVDFEAFRPLLTSAYCRLRGQSGLRLGR